MTGSCLGVKFYVECKGTTTYDLIRGLIGITQESIKVAK
jgi:hypothetical protein